MRLRLSCLAALVVALPGLLPAGELPTAPEAAARPATAHEGIVDLALDDAGPLRVPTHPGRTTTVVFPEPPGVPDGAGFTSDPATIAGDFQVSWSPGDRHLSIVPLRPGKTRNLNVPCGALLVVLLVEPAPSPEAAVLLLRLHTPAPQSPQNSTKPESLKVARTMAPPPSPYEAATPARLVGLLTRLKLVHACPPGEPRLALLRSLRAVSFSEPRLRTCGDGFRIDPVLVLRDERLDLIGFVVLLTNETDAPLRIEPDSWAARAGAGFYRAATCEGPSVLSARETEAFYFVIQGNGRGGPGHLAAGNDWEFSVSRAPEAPAASEGEPHGQTPGREPAPP